MIFKYFFILIFLINKLFSIEQDFICTNGNIININKICNGKIDCPDGSDETKELCYHIICPKDTYRCFYGACVKAVQKCNGQFECADKSDESQCGRSVGSCEENEFQCKSGQCIPVKNMCDGVKDCSDDSDESDETCDELPCPENSFHCKHGGCIHLDARCNGIHDCLDGSDETEVLCRNLHCVGQYCQKLRYEAHCSAIDISRINAICQSKLGGIVPCDNPVPAGAKVKYSCKSYFIPINNRHVNNTHAKCQLDGTWNRELLKCKPDCGKINADVVPLVVNGWDVNKIIYPWHAQMYVKKDSKWQLWCGGTLITEKIVLTANHCVWNIEKYNIKLIFGKYFTKFSTYEPDSRIRNVKEIVNQPIYQDRNGNFGSDIAILVLEKPLPMTLSIHPACIDWNLRDTNYHLRENSIGMVVGMGVTEEEETSKTLKGIYLPIVSKVKCIKEQVRDFKKYVTYTVICAGWKNGSGVCNGDSGGGFLFPKLGDNSKWVLQGIVSVSPRRLGTSFCDPEYYTVFTKVSSYLNWIKEVLQNFNQTIY